MPLQLVPSRATLDARTLAGHFGTMQPGELVEYATLDSLVQYDLRKERPWVLARARQIAEREYRRVYGTIRRVGVQCLRDEEMAGLGEVFRRTVQRRARRTLNRLSMVRGDQLNEAQLYRTLAYASIAGAVLAVTHVRTLQQAETVIKLEPTPQRLDVGRVKRLL